MKNWFSVFASMAIVGLTGAVAADGLIPLQQRSDNGAQVIFDQGCVQGWVDVSGNSTPFFPNGEGLILVLLLDSVTVQTPPNAGRINLACHGTLPLGEQALAFDFPTGELISATLATRDELCNAVSAVWPNACRGANGPFLSTFETVGVECSFNLGDTTLFTRDWISVTTQSGSSMINCHFDLDDATERPPVSVIQRQLD